MNYNIAFLGKIDVYYQLKSATNTTYHPASILDDIGLQQNRFTMEEGQDTIKITLPLADDQMPEPDEAFNIVLTSVKLVSTAAYNDSNKSPPIIGKFNTSLVVIEANDGARGELSFAPRSVK